MHEQDWLQLPYEIWLKILVDYGITAADLASVDRCCKWFSYCFGGKSLTEEAARIIIRKYKVKRFGELTNRVSTGTWKERLNVLDTLQFQSTSLAAGSFQNVLTLHGHLLTWGAGLFGQLGNNELEDKATAQDTTNFIYPQAGKIVQVSAGCGHTGLITEKGYAFTCGDDRYNQLGHSDFRGKLCTVPKRVTENLGGVRCVQIACGSSHTLFLTEQGKVYAVGQGDTGQLGLGDTMIARTPTSIPFPYDEYNIVSIAAGIAHNILVSECGKAFTFGLGSSGQLGHGGTKYLSKATMVAVLWDKKIIAAAAGVSHSIFLDSKGAVYTCGSGRGILGHNNSRICTVPVKVQALEGIKIARIIAGVTMSIFIAHDGIAFWCGEDMVVKGSATFSPRVMPLPEPVESAAIGNTHVVLLLKSGRLMSVGSNGRFQTGHSRTEVVQNYTYLDLNVKPIA